MKARDIIPGWPRGKSTSGPTVPTLWLPSNPNIYESVSEALLQSLYHESQQAMVDRWVDQKRIERAYVARIPKPHVPDDVQWALHWLHM